MRRRPNLNGLLSKTLILLFIAVHVETIPLNRQRVSQQLNETFVVKTVPPTPEISSISNKRNFSAEIRRNHSKVKRETTCGPGASICPFRNETTGTYDCLHQCQKCDGVIDCPRATDEVGCPCRSRLSSTYICDGEIDCRDYSDELGCGVCFNDEFKCGEECVSIKDICRGKKCDQFSRHLICTRLTRTPFENSDTTYRSQGYLQMLVREEWLTVCGELSERSNVVASDYCYEITGIKTHTNIFKYKEIPLIEAIKWAELKVENGHIIASEIDGCSERLVAYVECPQPLPQSKRESLFNIKITKRIVGGDDAKDEDWRFLVRILKNSEHHCGGSILSDRWVLSASHCFLRVSGVMFEVEAGSRKTGVFGPRVQRRLVSHIVKHPLFDPYTMANDVALVRVLTPLHITKWIRPSMLMKDGESVPKDAMCYLAGWGYQSEEGDLAKMLQEVSVPILEEKACLNEFLYIDPEKVICAGHERGRKDSCQGDSGGPMMCNLCTHPYDPSECGENFWIQVAIVSFGRGCARPGIPGVYTDVKYFLNWILDTMREMSHNSSSLPELVPQIVCSGLNCEYTNGTCLPINRICDHKVDCMNAEDEISCASPIRSKYFNKKNKIGDEDGEYDDYEVGPNYDNDYDDSKNENYNNAQIERGNKTDSCSENHFKCELIPGCIPNSLLCDEERNCRDGSDELRCTCVDRIFLTHRNKICNGVYDCPDKSDEFCDLCGEDEWLCQRSGQCLSIENVCDAIPHCKYGEDELNCLTLAPEGGILTLTEEGGHPTISNNGYVLIYSAKSSTWDPVCLSEMSHQVAEDICYYLGFKGPQSIKYNSNLPSTYEIRQGGGGSPREKRFISLPEAVHDFKISSRRLEIRDRPWQLQQNFKAFQEKTTSALVVVKNFTKDELDDGLTLPHLPMIAVGGNRRAFETLKGRRRPKRMACNQVRVECGEKICGKVQTLHFSNAPPLDDASHVPWAVKIYKSGKYLCEGTLIASQWVLCRSECVSGIRLQEEEIHILGGFHRGIFGFPYMSPSEIDIRIDAIVTLEEESNLTLLHLEESTKGIEQLNSVCFNEDNLKSTSWRECLIVGTYEDGATETFLLVPKEKCEEDFLCFEDYLPLQEVCLKSWPGLIACRKERKSTSPWTAVAISNFTNENCFNFHNLHQIISKQLVQHVYKKLEEEIQPTSSVKCDGHKCPLGLCIPKSEVCDGKISCADISDEGYSCPLPIKLCTVKDGKCECSANEFKCSDGVCITADKMCNGVAECVNGDDEEKCSCLEKVNEKDNDQMPCDGTIDCRDESDEMNCGCDLTKEFRCYKSSNQSCIPRSQICDTVADCEMGEDEAYCFTISSTVFPEENILGVPSFSNKGYLLLRVKGIWYTYFIHNWSSSNSDLVCQSFGYLGKSETKGMYLNPSIFTSKANDVLPVLESEENKLVVYIICSV